MEETYRGLTIKIEQDVDPESPREWDNVGTMVCFHGRYTLGDKHEFSSPTEFLEWWEENGEDGVLLPLYLYDHSGITISTSPFSCPWDSGQVGWIYATKETLDKETFDIDHATKYLIGEVETYDQYLTGQVYGYEVEDEDGNFLASCWGFYGEEDAIQEARADADGYANERDTRESNL